MFGFYLMDLQTYADAEKWPIVSAELVSGEIEEIKRRRGRSSKYRLNLEYRYEVAGKVYQNDKIQVLDDDFSERSAAEKALKSYQALPALTVYYSESNPATSILKPKIPLHSVIFVVLLWLLLVCWCYVFVVSCLCFVLLCDWMVYVFRMFFSSGLFVVLLVGWLVS